MAAAMVNGAGNAPDPNGAVSPISTSAKPQPKSSFNNKASDSNRRPPGGANEGAQRRTAPPKAWQSGMNPLTQRSTTPGQQNGVGSQNKAGSHRPFPSQETNAIEKQANDRLLSLFGNALGMHASITVKNGDVFTGVFFGANMENNDSSYILKMVQQIKASNRGEANGVFDSSTSYIGRGEDYAMTFDTKEVINLAIEGIVFDGQPKLQNGSSGGFRIDTDISGNTAMPERDLQRWEPSNNTDTSLSLEASTGPWDQFQANEQRFGLKSDYDENLYTTRIDRSRPDYRQREAEARRIAQEIEGSSTNNIHLMEERGMIDEDGGLNEEEKYSGVARHSQDFPALQSGQSNRYMPPARRLPTPKAATPGAPPDPAIVASQIARKDCASATKEVDATLDHSPIDANARAVKARPVPEQTKELARNDEENSATSNRPPSSSKGPIPSDSATANVEVNLLDSFRNFANIEKMRVSDHRRQRVSHDKAIKLNDLMKFSKNFNLKTPVPKDLVPILAKDKSKQEEIMEKAQRNAQQYSNASASATAATSEPKTLKTVPEGPRETIQAPPVATDRQDYPLNRHGYPAQGQQPTFAMRERQMQSQNPNLTSEKSTQGYLGHRLHDSHGQHKTGMRVVVPPPIPTHSNSRSSTRPPMGPTSSSQTPSSVRTPTSAVSSKFNIRAPEFKPNPAANAFRPGGGGHSAISSPISTPSARPMSRVQSPSAFFKDRKPPPPGERPSINDYFNPLERLKENAVNEGKAKDYSSNGGIKYAFTTAPPWKMRSDDSVMKSYADMFEEAAPTSGKISPQPMQRNSSAVPHQHQLPQHLQIHGTTPHVQTPHPAPFPGQPQAPSFSSGQHHYDEHRLHLSASNATPYHPSPRMQNNPMAFPSPMQQSAQLAYGQPIPQYMVNPNVPQPTHFRAPYPGAPQMMPVQGAQLAAPMMVQQSSQNGFMAPSHGMTVPFNPQVSMYPPGQTPSYGGQSQPPSGFPSPGRGAPMMMHQGSHQGQQPIYMNPNQYGQPMYAQQQPPNMMQMRAYGSPQPGYSQSPQPQYNVPHQQHRAASNSYGQSTHAPHHHPHQHQHHNMHHPPPNMPMESGDDMK